ncbi:prepilin-type N-terminal cleavage/methylation domain-containing protein [Lampropedia puyangensis]|uniref:Prepilin-type N-terminal cleavage/methylation domain-containing protein n=1 Tax=Lampropedia puyangensis TaxID=1330072 RepID=A0A4S8F191_9BURK|nr:prepilin-type N-terminal cleavage/methylation domain-containing protein [Lampropedia puyangensis]THU01040.1 prepilin-type N-terminal cleavage/methylation domain-containing protein [Lampropedia puyangensis]
MAESTFRPPMPTSKSLTIGTQHSGFTLLEMLVAVALLSLVMLGLASSFFSLGQTETRIDARLDQSSQLRASMNFLDQTLGRVSARRRTGLQNTNESRFWFEGTGQTVQWVGIMPPRYGAGGRYFFMLQLEGSDLVLRFTPWNGAPQFPSPSGMDARTLQQDVTQFSIQYRGEEQDSIDWTDVWTFTEQMPSHIMLNIVTAQMALPTKILAMRAAGLSAQGSGLAVVGGGRR